MVISLSLTSELTIFVQFINWSKWLWQGYLCFYLVNDWYCRSMSGLIVITLSDLVYVTGVHNRREGGREREERSWSYLSYLLVQLNNKCEFTFKWNIDQCSPFTDVICLSLFDNKLSLEIVLASFNLTQLYLYNHFYVELLQTP